MFYQIANKFERKSILLYGILVTPYLQRLKPKI